MRLSSLLRIISACLLLSGLLSWFNFMGTCWRLSPPGPWRAGHDALVTVEIENRTAQFDLTLAVGETLEGLRISFQYNCDLFEAATVKTS